MPDYGVTPKGVVIKRFDTIINELHTDLSDGWGVNTRLNPKSFLNVQLTAIADKIAELWEFGEELYHSMCPFSAEGANLDNAVQFGGVSREDARPTFYPIHCECVDGTTIPKGSLIKTSTNPAIQFLAATETTVTRSAFNIAKIRVAVVPEMAVYTVALNGALYSYTSDGTDTEESILSGLAAAITDTSFDISVSEDSLIISSVNPGQSHELVLSGNLTTRSVTGIVNYASETSGDIAVPDGAVTQIVTDVPGLISVVNRLPRVAGRHLQSDAELRKSYADKIFARSNRMIESIKSAILQNVQGVRSVAGYQNDTSIPDDWGRWPHCVEMVVDGGSDYEIAAQIWDKKTDGIQTYGNIEVVIPGDEGEHVTIRFNRPEPVYVWFNVSIAMSGVELLPPNYVDVITEIALEEMAKVEPGKPIIPQRIIEGKIFGAVPGIARIETRTFYTTDSSQSPGAYATGIVPVTPRQRAVTDETRIGVTIV